MSARLTPTGAPLADHAAAPAPARLGRYTLLDKLGEGAMGVVYRAHDPQLDRTVALKTFHQAPDASANASVASALRLRNEAQAAARLSHPGIVAVYEYGEDGAQSFIAMEYVRGVPLLAGMTRPAALPIDDVLCLMVQLLVALQCAHDQGVWHRDIKPANLIVTRDGRLKITDFGIAKMVHEAGSDAAALPRGAGVMGSPGYLAPECYASGALGDQRADVYACGVLLFELLTGARPFRGSPDVVMYKTLQLPAPPLAAPDDPQFVPLARFAHVVQRALAKSPDERYASALDMRLALTLAAERAVPYALSEAAMLLLALPPAGQDNGKRSNTAPSAPAAAPERASASAPVPAPVAAPVAAAPVAPTPVCAPAPQPMPQPFDPALLARLTAELVNELGPLAHHVVQRAAARGDHNAAALLVRVANDALPASRRGAFIESMRAVLSAYIGAERRGPATHPPTGAVLPVLNDELGDAAKGAPLEPRLLAAAQALVAQYVGPMAPMLVGRAAAGAATREQFIGRLAGLTADGGEREDVLVALRRLC